jgi:ferritin-like metal-binding protein YciE
MAETETPARNALLVKYLNEAYGKEKQLETMLAAQISLAKRPQLKKGLQEHLKVTKAQARGLEKRIKELGGKASVGPELPGPDVVAGAAGAAAKVANRALAGAKAPMQAMRGTSPPDNDLRMVRDGIWNEAEEIAHYDVIEAAAEALADTDSVKLARTFRKDEERMQRLLERQIPPLMKEVIMAEVPAPERRIARRPAARTRTARTTTTSPRASAPRRSGATPPRTATTSRAGSRRASTS